MYHALLRDASFWVFLSDVDEDLAESARRRGVRAAGGRTAPTTHPRKPRGLDAPPAQRANLRHESESQTRMIVGSMSRGSQWSTGGSGAASDAILRVSGVVARPV